MKKQLYFSQPDSENWTWPVTAKTYVGLTKPHRKIVIKNGLPSIEVKKDNDLLYFALVIYVGIIAVSAVVIVRLLKY